MIRRMYYISEPLNNKPLAGHKNPFISSFVGIISTYILFLFASTELKVVMKFCKDYHLFICVLYYISYV